MNTGQHVTEALAAYAADALDQAESDQIRAHLAGCPACQAELTSLRVVTDRLANLAPRRQPQPRLRQRVLAVVERAAQPPRGAPRLAFVRWAWAGLTAVLLVGQVWLAASLLSLRAQLNLAWQVQTILLSSDAAPVKLQPPGPGSAARGVYRFESELRRGVLSYYHLPTPGASQTYRCWFDLPNGTETACGELAIGPEGSGLLLLTLPETAPARLRVTLEAARTASPAGPTILTAALSPDSQ